MRKNYYLIDVVTKAKCFGFTDEEIEYAVKEGLNRFELLKRAQKTVNKKAKEKLKEEVK